MGLACVNVDLDSISHYLRIHGLDEAGLAPEATTFVYRRAIARFLELFEEAGIPATLFAVGADLVDRESAAALAAAAGAGHELGNHSFSHDYALTRRSPAELARDVADGEEAIHRATGIRPLGFRAPGYTMTAPLLRVLEGRGYAYDSSVFPATPYYLAKAAVMGALAARGRPSRAILDRPRVMAAPRLPYRPDLDEPYRRGGARILELPISVAPRARVPFIGTAAVALPRPAVAAIYRMLRGQPFLNFELHGIDLIEAADLGLPMLARAQPDLRVTLARKRARLREVLGWIRADFEVVTLAAAAERWR